MTFKAAKQIIRVELTLASDEKLAEVIDAARAGKMPYHSYVDDMCIVCLAGRILGEASLPFENHSWWILSDAYGRIGLDHSFEPSVDHYEDGDEARRQRVVLAMALAELRRRWKWARLRS